MPTNLTLVPYGALGLRMASETVGFPLDALDTALIKDMLFSVLPPQLAEAERRAPLQPEWRRHNGARTG